MSGQSERQPPRSDLMSVEGHLLGAMFTFHRKVTSIVRQSSLNERQMQVVTERATTLLDEITADLKHNDTNAVDRLDAAYAQIEGLIAELSESAG
jgi:hypothetical protein